MTLMRALFSPWLDKLSIHSLPLLQTETREEFGWEHLPELWVVFLVIIPLVALMVIFIYRKENPQSRDGSGENEKNCALF